MGCPYSTMSWDNNMDNVLQGRFYSLKTDRSVAQFSRPNRPPRRLSVSNRPVLKLAVPNRPVVNSPVLQLSVLDRHVVQFTVPKRPVVQFPVPDRPVMQLPVADRPVLQLPVPDRPVLQLSVPDRPVMQLPVADRPVLQLPVPDRPVLQLSVPDRPVMQLSHIQTVQSSVQISTQSASLKDDIAIVGIGCRTPGADNIREFWRLLRNGECHVTDVPANRWNASAYFSEDPTAIGKAYVQKGGFVKDLEYFDSGLFGISDLEAIQMDPQQRLILECTSMALEDAGFTRDRISGSNMGVFIGAMNCDHRTGSAAFTSNIGTYTATGSSSSVISARVSYVFNLLGPCIVVDSACSASLAALHLACQAICTGDCDTAICGGVNSMTLPDLFVTLSKARIISRTGLCQAFSANADGYVRSEGCGIIILKRLQEAICDGDKVWATVCTGTNQDGRTVIPMTAPSGIQQEKLLRFVHDKFHVDAESIDYIEAHGTGTVVGDPVEVNALGTYLKKRSRPRDRYIGSLKTNIGHTESASGALSVIKLVLMMKHGLIVPSLHCDVVNPKINLADLRLIIPKETIPWSKPDKLTCCNSFGFGGSNCHAVLRSYSTPENRDDPASGPCVVCFSGRTLKSLKGSLQDLYTDEEAPLLNVNDVSYTSTVRRDHFSYRAAFIVDSMQDLMSAVGECLSANVWSPPAPRQLQICFVFCGMGTAWAGMCRQLLTALPVFKDTFTDIESHLSSYVDWSLTKRLQQEDISNDPVLGPIAIFAYQVGLAAVWRSLGIQPGCIVGQSIGEVAAAHCAGCLTLADAVKVIYHRSELLAQVTGGSMVIVRNVDLEKVREVLKTSDIKASISLEYSDKTCAISTSSDTLPSLKKQLLSSLKNESRSMQMIDMNVSVAYHSPFVQPCTEKLHKALGSLNARSPKIPFFSGVTGEPLASATDTMYWVDNMRKPVLFKQAIKHAYNELQSLKAIFLEIGPKPVLKAHLKDLFPDRDITTVASVAEMSEADGFLKAVVQLYGQGLQLAWENLPSAGRVVTNVPRYAFDKKFLLERSELQLMISKGLDFIHMNHMYTGPIQDGTNSFLLVISPLFIPSVFDHVAFGKIVVPGSYYAEAGLAIARYCDIPFPVLSVEFEHAVTMKRNEITDFTAQCEATAQKTNLKVVVRKEGRRVATVRIKDIQPSSQEPVNLEHIRSKAKDVVSKTEIYSALSNSGFQYGEAFSLLEKCWKYQTDCLTMLKVNETIRCEMASTIFHPSILDCVLQSTAMVTPKIVDKKQEVLPKSIGKLVVHRQMELEMYVYTRLKSQDNKRIVFDQQVISARGDVIATITDFVLQSLKPQAEEAQSTFIRTKWEITEVVAPFELQKDFTVLKTSDAIFVTDASFLKENGNHISVDFTSDTDPAVIINKLKSILSEGKTATTVVLVFSWELKDGEEDGRAVQKIVVNACCLIQAVLNYLNERSDSIPFYLCTFGAWSSETDNDNARNVNPAATALWGLMRTAAAEHVYPHAVAVDFHLSSVSPNYHNFSAVFHTLLTNTKLHDYPELLVTTAGIYVNQVVKDNENSSEKINDSDTVLDVRGDLNTHQFTKLRPRDVVRGNEDLIKIEEVSHNLHLTTLALEVRGLVEGGTSEEMVSCCPVRVGNEVVVPNDVVIPTLLIPGYQLGDLSKLVVLWSLAKNTRSEKVTLLTSVSSRPLAKILKLMCSSQAENDDTDIIVLNDLHSTGGFRGTLVSLVFMDSSMMTYIANKWSDAKCLVACSSHVSAGALSVLTCTLPTVDMTLVDTRSLFIPCKLRKSIPQIKTWMTEIKAMMNRVSEALHSGKCEENTVDLSHLLQFPPISFTSKVTAYHKDASYIVVGGLTGLGWTCVEFLAQNNAGHIVIINRRAPSAKQITYIGNLSRSFNCQIQTFRADVTSMKDLKNVYKQMSESSSFKLRGVFFGAAILQDGKFSTMARSAFDNVLAPKVAGSWNLHQLTKKLPLDFFIIHSSIVSVIGNMGQANYVTGNAFLDGLAYHRHQQGLAAQTLNWGPLDIGLLDGQDVIKEKMKAVGFHVFNMEEINATLKATFYLQHVQIISASINPVLYGRRLYSTPTKALTLRFQKFASPSSVQQQVNHHQGLADASKIKLLTEGQRMPAYEDYLRHLISQVLIVETSQISRDTPLLDLGMDSLSGTLVLDKIQQDTSFKLVAVDIFAGESTVATLAKVLNEHWSL